MHFVIGVAVPARFPVIAPVVILKTHTQIDRSFGKLQFQLQTIGRVHMAVLL